VRLADDPGVDYRRLVREGYDRCSAAYEVARAGETQAGLDLVLERLPPGSRVLDLGCGTGTPVTALLAQSHRVTGVDFSAEQVRRARANVPGARILESDIMGVDFEPGSFDAVVSFYAIFHLPREEHSELFGRIYRWLAPGGYFLATVTRARESAYLEDHFFGVTMYWSNWSRGDYEAMAREVGFELLDSGAIGHGYGDGAPGRVERHELLFARKP
jgi:cyclopropane fatty-acyl-phospholipid synthase-like methyltransferase